MKKIVIKEKYRKMLYSSAALALCGAALFGFGMTNRNNMKPDETTTAEPSTQEVKVNIPVTNVPDDRDVTLTTETEMLRNKYFALPLENGTAKGYSNGEIVKNLTTDDWRTHNGVDLTGVAGDPVKAINNGVVKEVYDGALWGTVVVIDHYGGLIAEYRGLGRGSTVTEGQTVKINDKVGNLGEIPIERKDGAHLHLEIYKDGKAVSPSDYLGKIPKL